MRVSPEGSPDPRVTAEQVKAVAHECGFELAGITPALPHPDYSRFAAWREAGHAAELQYLTDQRGNLRADPRNLLPEARTLLCVAKLYNSPHPHTDPDPEKGWISRYAWGDDYHEIMRDALHEVVERLQQLNGGLLSYRICVDTAPLLERSYAQSAGLGWIGKNTCLINQEQGSWFFLAELLLSIDLKPDSPPPERCGTCTRCIDACPTQAIVPGENDTWTLNAGLCISYLTIEKRGSFDDAQKPMPGNHIFGCDICQDVCPWNGGAATTTDERFWPRPLDRHLEFLSQFSPEYFQNQFRQSPVKRAKYEGFMRNIAAALGCLLIALQLHSAPVPADNPGFQHFYNLEYDAALKYFELQAKTEPHNLTVYNNIAQSILYRQMYREGELTTSLVDSSNSFLTRPKLHFSQADRNEFDNAIDHVLSLSEKTNDPISLYAVGVAYGLRATFSFGEKDYIPALKSAAAANRAEEQVLALDPKFTDARLIPGVYKYIAGSLPVYLRVLTLLGGFQGSIEDGIHELETVRTNGVLNRYDAEILLAAIYRREHEPKKAIPLLLDAAARFPRNPLLSSELAAVQREERIVEAHLGR